MPELPEVETTCRGIRPHLCGQTIQQITVLNAMLRWPVSPEIASITATPVLSVRRRAKYLLLDCGCGHLLIHLGMSGSLRICPPDTPLRTHDHVVLQLSSGLQMRFHDPRRFGCWLWIQGDPLLHPLLRHLGPEPLGDSFHGSWLKSRCHQSKAAIKSRIMDQGVVVGVGNIYACEALFHAGIRPSTAAGRLPIARLQRLAEAIKAVLQQSINQGGTTLRDFLREDNQPGYFSQQLSVYGRESQPCSACASPITRIVLGQRSTFFCKRCQLP